MTKVALYPHQEMTDPMNGAAHMPPAVVAIVAAAAATFGPVLFGGAIATIGSLGVMGSFLLRAGLGLALNALAPKPSSASGGYKVTASGTALDHQIVYGMTRCAGVRVFDGSSGTDNLYLHRVVAFTGHEIDAFSEVYINDELATIDGTGNVTSPSRYSGKIRIIKKLGADSQTAITEMVSEVPNWTTNHRLRGIAYLYIRFTFDSDAFPNGVPEITSVIRGKKVYDPRTATTAWSDNSALCIRDYLTNTRYGRSAPSSEIDDVLCQVAANLCDTIVESEKRYTCNGNFTTGAQPVDILRNLLTSMGGLLWYSQGKWRMKAAGYTSPVESFTLSDFRSDISISTRNSRRDNFNTVKGKFRGPESNWQTTDYNKVTDAAFVTEDNGFESSVDLELPFTDSNLRAQRIAKIFLKRNREQISFSASFGVKAFRVQIGDNVSITIDKYGWTNKVFEVASWTFTVTEELELIVNMALRETSSSVYTDASGSLLIQNNTNLPSAFITLPPTGLATSSIGVFNKDGTFVNGISVSWNAIADAFVEDYSVQWKKTTDTRWKKVIVDNALDFVIYPVTESVSYNIRVRGRNFLKSGGPFASTTHTAGPDTTAPGLPTGITATGGFQCITLKWTNPADTDFSHIQIWEAATNSFAAATKVGESYGDTYVRPNLGPAVLRYYWLKSVDRSDNVSTQTTVVSATTSRIVSADITARNVTRAAMESGAVSDLLVTSSTVTTTDTTSAGYGVETYLTEHTHSFGTTADTCPEEVSVTVLYEASGVILNPAVTTALWRTYIRLKVEVYWENKTTAVQTLAGTMYIYPHDVSYLDGYARSVFDAHSVSILQFDSSTQHINEDLVIKYYWRKARTTTAGGIALTDASVSATTIALFR